MKILTEQEVDDIQLSLMRVKQHGVQNFARAIESAVLEKLKDQVPVAAILLNHPDVITDAAWAIDHKDDPDCQPLYAYPLPPDDVVRDAERWRAYVKLYSEHNGVPEEDVVDEIDAAMKEMK